MSFRISTEDARERLENLEATVGALIEFIDHAESVRLLGEARVLVVKARDALPSKEQT